MEQSGVPGRVHLSWSTKSALNNDYKTAPGRGYERNEWLAKHSNLDTYLIEVDTKRTSVSKKTATKNKMIEGMVGIDSAESKSVEEQVEEYLSKAIDARSIDKLKSDYCKSLMLTFRKDDLEEQYRNSDRDSMYIANATCTFLTVFFLIVIHLFMFCTTPFVDDDNDGDSQSSSSSKASQIIITEQLPASVYISIIIFPIALVLFLCYYFLSSDRVKEHPICQLSPFTCLRNASEKIVLNKNFGTACAVLITVILFTLALTCFLVTQVPSPHAVECTFNHTKQFLSQQLHDAYEAISNVKLNRAGSHINHVDKNLSLQNFSLAKAAKCHDDESIQDNLLFAAKVFPSFVTCAIILTFLVAAAFRTLETTTKCILLSSLGLVYCLVVSVTHYGVAFEFKDKLFFSMATGCTIISDHVVQISSPEYCPAIVQTWFILIMFIVAITMQARQNESTSRLDFLWKIQAREEKEDMQKLQAYNKKLLLNILPSHVTEYFLKSERKDESDLYCEKCDLACIMFAKISNFSSFYTELDCNGEGMECLRLLNEILHDFDEIIGRPKYSYECYMAASGLSDNKADRKNWSHVAAIADYAMELTKQLQYINEHAFNNFQLRIGISMGPIVAGVIGAKKPQYDIWGNPVNVASRMESTGLPGRIQVTEEVYHILCPLGYRFECRGKIDVKGKGIMTTYFLLEGKDQVSKV